MPSTDYITSSALKSTLSLSGETYADDDIARAITAASRAIDTICKRRFYADADVNQVRYYTPVSHRLVSIDDLVTLTELATGPGDGTFPSTWTENTHFVLNPLNAAADGKPWTSIRAVRCIWAAYLPRTVRVTGKFGWSSVPTEIEQATGILAAKLVKRAREAPFGVLTIGFETGDVARIAKVDPDIVGLTAGFVRPLVR